MLLGRTRGKGSRVQPPSGPGGWHKTGQGLQLFATAYATYDPRQVYSSEESFSGPYSQVNVHMITA